MQLRRSGQQILTGAMSRNTTVSVQSTQAEERTRSSFRGIFRKRVRRTDDVALRELRFPPPSCTAVLRLAEPHPHEKAERRRQRLCQLIVPQTYRPDFRPAREHAPTDNRQVRCSDWLRLCGTEAVRRAPLLPGLEPLVAGFASESRRF